MVLVGLWMMSGDGQAAEPEMTLTVALRGVDRTRAGVLRCALYDGADGFPMDPSRALARVVASPADDAPVCRFTVRQAGAYAVAVGHDEDGNGRVNTNFLGIPKEGWASSKNVVPALRAPRFDESSVVVDAPSVRITVDLHY